MKQTGFSSFAAETLVFFILAAYESKLSTHLKQKRPTRFSGRSVS
jgi:hypothetical protein